MSLQSLEALETIGATPSTKWILPLETSSLAQSFSNRMTASNGVESANETVEAL